jgi:hypothetical protein
VPLWKLIGRGATSEVYEWSADTVVKFFVAEFEELAAVELERSRAIHAAGVPCPACTGWSRWTVGPV